MAAAGVAGAGVLVEADEEDGRVGLERGLRAVASLKLDRHGPPAQPVTAVSAACVPWPH